MSFRITGLPAERFAQLFALSDAELAAQGAVRQTADARQPGYPCRQDPIAEHDCAHDCHAAIHTQNRAPCKAGPRIGSA